MSSQPEAVPRQPDAAERLPTVVCHEQGDAILLIGGTQPIRVATSLLAQCSHVFAAMFDGRFAEGQALDSSNPPDIAFPEDDPEAMLMLCRLIHQMPIQFADWTKDETFQNIVELAKVADKYHCNPFVSTLLQVMLSFPAIERDIKVHQLIYLLTAAYVLDDQKNFRGISLRIALRLEGPSEVFELARSMGPDAVLHQLLLSLLELQLKMMGNFRSRLLAKIPVSDPRNLPFHLHMQNQYLSPNSVEDLRDALASIAAHVKPYNEAGKLATDTQLKAGMDLYTTRNLQSGLCLRCVKTGGKPASYSPHQHDS